MVLDLFSLNHLCSLSPSLWKEPGIPRLLQNVSPFRFVVPACNSSGDDTAPAPSVWPTSPLIFASVPFACACSNVFLASSVTGSAASFPAPAPAPLASLPGTSYRSVGHVLCLRLIRKLIPNFPAAAAISSWDLRRCVVAFALSFLSLLSHLHQYLRSPASPSSLTPALTNRASTL